MQAPFRWTAQSPVLGLFVAVLVPGFLAICADGWNALASGSDSSW